MVTVRTGARLHFGFQNLSLAHERLYGGVGVALAEPTLAVAARPAEEVHCEDDELTPVVRRVVATLGVPGADVRVVESYPRHVGLGSGTQFTLATLAAVARAHARADEDFGLASETDAAASQDDSSGPNDSAGPNDAAGPNEPAGMGTLTGPGEPSSREGAVDVRALAPALERGGRSGVGVACFEGGGIVVDGGHPTEQFTTEPPATGEWTVPPVVARHEAPADWRFVLVVPEAEAGRSGPTEDRAMRSVVRGADPGIADDVAGTLTRAFLPAAATGDRRRFGTAAARIGRLNGAWYADTQGGVYRPPAGPIVERLRDATAITGAGQSSWGPVVWGLTDRADAEEARTAAEMALSGLDLGGDVHVVAPRNEGATVEGLRAGGGPV